MMDGPDLENYTSLLKRFKGLYLIASGGVGDIIDLDALENAGIPAVIMGKAIYEGSISEEEIQNFLND